MNATLAHCFFMGLSFRGEHHCRPDIESYGYGVRKLNSRDSSGGSGGHPLDWSLVIVDVPCRPQIQVMLAPCSGTAGPRTKV
jgi:hypothetical protein